MKLLNLEIRNFRNLRYAACDPVPDFAVICGANGCGKSAFLEAIMTAKEHAGSYGEFAFDPRAVAAGSETATIALRLAFNDQEREFVQKTWNEECPPTDDIVIEIKSGGNAQASKRSRMVRRLLAHYSSEHGSPGFFDYINAYRFMQKNRLTTWDAKFLSAARGQSYK